MTSLPAPLEQLVALDSAFLLHLPDSLMIVPYSATQQKHVQPLIVVTALLPGE